METPLSTIEQVLVRIVEKLPHAAETEATHLIESIHAHFAAENADAPDEKTDGDSNAASDNSPIN